MNSIQEDRRKVVKNLILAGFSLHLIGCTTTESPANTSSKDENPIDPKLDQAVEALASNNVTYFKRGEGQFDKLATYFNKFAERSPSIIALVVNAAGVSEAIEFARKNNLPIAVKSGGHSFEQFSSSDGGLVINLSLLNTIEWLPDNQVKIGPACLLREMYDELLPKGRILPAGSCGTVGVGGLTLGGGYGFFARKYGLTCDNLQAATFVDGNGKIHEVSGNHELMWAMRGGGNGNFGVATSFTFATKPAPKTFNYVRFKAKNLALERAKVLLQTWFEHASALPEDCFSAFVLNGQSLTILITSYDGNSTGLSAMVDALTPITDKITKNNNSDVAGALKNYYGIQTPIYFKNASAGYYSTFQDIEGCIDEVLQKVVTTPGLIYQVNTLGGAINSASNSVKSSYPHRNFEYLSELQSYWDEGQDAKRDNYLKVFEEIQTLFYENGNTAQYRNYPSIGFKHWEDAYYGENYSRLQRIKRKYDGENLFRHPQSVRIAKTEDS